MESYFTCSIHFMFFFFQNEKQILWFYTIFHHMKNVLMGKIWNEFILCKKRRNFLLRNRKLFAEFSKTTTTCIQVEKKAQWLLIELSIKALNTCKRLFFSSLVTMRRKTSHENFIRDIFMDFIGILNVENVWLNKNRSTVTISAVGYAPSLFWNIEIRHMLKLVSLTSKRTFVVVLNTEIALVIMKSIMTSSMFQYIKRPKQNCTKRSSHKHEDKKRENTCEGWINCLTIAMKHTK